jgi:hypothetical protein
MLNSDIFQNFLAATLLEVRKTCSNHQTSMISGNAGKNCTNSDKHIIGTDIDLIICVSIRLQFFRDWKKFHTSVKFQNLVLFVITSKHTEFIQPNII